MRLVFAFIAALALLTQPAQAKPGNPLVADDTRTVAMPMLTKTITGQVLLSWAEKDPAGTTYLYTALSADQGKTFSEKSLVYAAPGIGSSRLMKPRVLVQPNGTLVAVFTLRTQASKPATQQIMVSTSADQGRTWSNPQAVDGDPTPNLVRGFFDAVVLPNGELAITYLKDVAGSTKHEERNLRLVLTKNGQFQPERIIDPVACDCCNISMLVDATGALNVYYRDNVDNIRDIARLTSTDNGLTFQAPQTLYADNWKINGCPHSGPSSIRMGKSALVTWFSGTTSNTAGVRVVTQQGERLTVIEDPSAKNAMLVEAPNAGILVWDQVRGAGETLVTAIGYQVIKSGKAGETKWLDGSEQGQNASGVVVGNQLVVAYELKRPGKPNALQLGYVSL